MTVAPASPAASGTPPPVPTRDVPGAPRTGPLLYVKLALCTLFWGGTFIAGKVLAQAMPHFTAAAGRFAVASACLLLVAWKLEGGLPRLDRRQAAATALLGVTGIFLYNVFFLAALGRLPASRTALIIALNPVVTALAMALVIREPLSASRWMGIAVALVGAAIVITRGDATAALSQSVGTGELLMFGGVCAWAVYTIVGRRALEGMSPIAATTYASLWGGAMLAACALTELSRLEAAMFTDWRNLAAIGYLGFFGTVLGFIWYYEGVRALGPARTAVFNNLVPVFGVLLGALLLGEPILVSMLVGGALVIAGVTLTNRTARTRA